MISLKMNALCMFKSMPEQKSENFCKKIAEKFGSLKKVRTFAIPKQTKRWW